MKKKLIVSNLAATFFLQIATIINGFVVPKIILSFFGSETNGLISSINQFLNYITIVEGGIGSVILAALYKPLLNHDTNKINGVINAARKFFKKIAIIYLAYVIILSFIYPLFIKGEFSYFYVVGLVFVLAINLFVQYYFSISYRLLLNADRKVYFVSSLQAIVIILNMAVVVICSILFRDILVIKLLSALVFCIIPIVYSKYVAKHYTLDKDSLSDENTISQRWDGFGINLAYFIHANTDIVILTIFSSLTNISVYSVYLMIIMALRGIVMSLSGAIIPSFGKVLADGNIDNTNKAFDIYQLGTCIITTVLFSCGIVLLTPFVDIYTLGIIDADYHQPLFGIILMLAEMIYCLRDPLVAVSYASGNFRNVSKYAYIEAGLNILISLILVNKYGLIGIAAGTTVAMLYRMIMQALFARRAVLYRPLLKFIKELLVFGINSLAICLVSSKCFDYSCETYGEWVVSAIGTFCLACIISIFFVLLFFRKQFSELIIRLRK